jgi:tetratricopeptide (TPR) repeat protein
MTPFEMHEHAQALAQQGKLEQAIELGTAALVGLRQSLGDDDPQVAVAATNLASYYAGLERWSEALPYYLDGLDRKIRQYGADHPTCANTLFRIARCHAALGDRVAAMDAYRRSIAIFERHPEANASIHFAAMRELTPLARAPEDRDEIRDLCRGGARLAARLLAAGDRQWEEPFHEAAAACLSANDLEGLMTAIRDGAGPSAGIVLLQGLADWIITRRRPTGVSTSGFTPRQGPWYDAFVAAIARLRAGDAAGAHEQGLAAAAIAREQSGDRSVELASALNLVAVACQDLGRKDEALANFQGAQAALEGVVPPADGLSLQAHYNVAQALGGLQRYAEAVEHLARIVAVRRAQQPRDGSALAIALYDVAGAAERAGDLDGALRAVGEASDVLPSEDPLRFAPAIKARCLELTLAAEPETLERPHALIDEGRFADAVIALRRLVMLLSWTVGATDLRTLEAQNSLGVSLLKSGQFREAESVLVDVHKTLSSMKDAPPADLAVVTGYLAMLRRHLGQFNQAEQLYETAIELWRGLGDRTADYARALISAAQLYGDVGRYDRARSLYALAQPIVAETSGTDKRDLVLLLSNRGLFELENGDAEQAITLLEEAWNTGRVSLGETHDYSLSALHNLGLAQRAVGRDAEAAASLERVLALKKQALGADNLSLAVTLTALGEIRGVQGRTDDAEALLERSLELRRRAYGDEHTAVARARGMLAQFAWKAGRFDKARAEFSAALSLYRRHLAALLPGMADDDRAQYWDTVSVLFDLYTAFALSEAARDSQTAGELFDLQLFRKSLLLECAVALHAAAAASGEAGVRDMYDEWLAAKRQLARALLEDAEPASAAKVDQLSAAVAAREKALAARLGRESMGTTTELRWRDVQAALAPSDAAVEIVRSPYSGVPGEPQAAYAALVLKGDGAPPCMVPLGSAAALEGSALEQYLNNREVVWGGSYDDFWRPLQAPLGAATRAYVAPDGVYGRLDLSILFRRDRKAFLGDLLDLRIVTSARDVCRAPAPAGERTAALFARPAYTVSVREDGEAAPQPFFGLLQATASFPDLPGTEEEVHAIESRLAGGGWRVQSFVRERASKAELQRIARPGLLHLATHGFYFEPQQTILSSPTRGAFAMLGPLDDDEPGARAFFRALAENGFSPGEAPLVQRRTGTTGPRALNPMFRSGVALAGAAGGPAEAVDPAGLLTAYEAGALDLHGTELVVLSACDSALGEIREGEGTFGLMRALRAAGAKFVLGAVWPVDDVVARAFMTAFYDAWLQSGDPRRALREARQSLRAVYPTPLQWGGFVLAG